MFDLHLFGPLGKIKRTLFPEIPSFTPCTPGLLIAIHQSLDWIRENLNSREGDRDYLEFGIYSGFTLWYTQALAYVKGIKNMRFFGFDSFQGLPKPEGLDRKGGYAKLEGAMCCNRSRVEEFLNDLGVDWSRLSLIEGAFKNTLTAQLKQQYSLSSCGICVIDCDLYEPTKIVLDFLASLIRDRCVLLIDDFNSVGQAFDEFLDSHPRFTSKPFLSFPHNGRGFIVSTQAQGSV